MNLKTSIIALAISAISAVSTAAPAAAESFFFQMTPNGFILKFSDTPQQRVVRRQAPTHFIQPQRRSANLPPLRYVVDNFGWGGYIPPRGISCRAYGMNDGTNIIGGRQRHVCN